MISKNDILTYFWCIFVRNSAATPPCRHSAWFYCYYRLPKGHEKSGWAVVCSPAQRQSGWQSVSGPGPWRVRGGGGFSVGLSLALSKWTLGAQHWSGQVSKTSRLYSTVTHHTHSTLWGSKQEGRGDKEEWRELKGLSHEIPPINFDLFHQTPMLAFISLTRIVRLIIWSKNLYPKIY
jgi:hypothetical protein